MALHICYDDAERKSCFNRQCRDQIVAEAQERLLGPDGALHPAEFEITELALVETTNEDPAKVHVVSGNPLTHATCRI